MYKTCIYRLPLQSITRRSARTAAELRWLIDWNTITTTHVMPKLFTSNARALKLGPWRSARPCRGSCSHPLLGQGWPRFIDKRCSGARLAGLRKQLPSIGWISLEWVPQSSLLHRRAGGRVTQLASLIWTDAVCKGPTRWVPASRQNVRLLPTALSLHSTSPSANATVLYRFEVQVLLIAYGRCELAGADSKQKLAN